MSAPLAAKQDSLPAKRDSLPTKRDSLPAKRDSLPAIRAYWEQPLVAECLSCSQKGKGG